MTRETKIGLLVGLAFIIVIGILLSEQVMRSGEPPQAQLGNAADTLRKGTVTPASQQRPVAPVSSAADASPDNVVPTQSEMTRRPPPVTIVEIRPGDGGGNGALGAPPQPYPPAGQGPVDFGGDRGPVNGGGGVPRNLADAAAGMGETLVGLDGRPLRASPNVGGHAPPVVPNNAGGSNNAPRPAPVAGGMKQYTVQPGDSLSKIAQKLMGSSNKANRDAIVKANPSLVANPDKVIIGATYNIPAAATVAAAPPPAAVVPPRPAAPVRPAAPAENFYVVQPGDNLTRIAKEQTGDVGTIAAIKELNKEVVKDWNVIVVGTKLRLPGKSVASAQ